MANKIDRAKLRGKPLDNDCRLAMKGYHEYGDEDNRIFCYGLADAMTDECLTKCKECGAFVYNATPLDK